jgi:hypothetical protein
MKILAILKLVIFSLLPIYSSGQVLNYVLSDTDLNGDKLTILFYDHLTRNMKRRNLPNYAL